MPLVTASAGNHGSALARAARLVASRSSSMSAAAPEGKARRHARKAPTCDCRDYDGADGEQHGHQVTPCSSRQYGHPDVSRRCGHGGLGDRGRVPEVDTIVVAVGVAG